MSMEFLPLLPLWVIALLAAALLGLLAWGCSILMRKRVSQRWIVILASLRVVIVAVLVLCLLQPVISWTRNVVSHPELLVLVDTSRNMGSPTTNADQPRLEAMLSTVRQPGGSGLAAHLEQNFDLTWFSFDEDARPVGSDPTQLQPTERVADYARSLGTAWNVHQVLQDSRPTAEAKRVLLISDGNDQGDEDAAALARQFGITVDVIVPPPSPTTEEDEGVHIAGVQSVRRVLLESEARFLVTLRRKGDREESLALWLIEDDEPIRQREVRFAAGQREKQVALAHRPANVGIRQYTVRLGDEPVGEAGEDNQSGDSLTLNLQVMDGRNEVLALGDTWGWSFKYLRRIFEDDPSFSFTALLSRGPQRFVQMADPDRQVDLAGFPQSRAELRWFDTIILNDADPFTWPEQLPRAVRDLVVEQGKSLIVIAGPNLENLGRVPALEGLLPVVITPRSADPIEGPIDIRLSRDGYASSLFFEPGVDGTSEIWGRLPPMDWVYPPLRKRPGATVLMEATAYGNEYGPLIVMAEQTVGRGRVLFIATDTLWKWQTLGPENQQRQTPYTLFWQQTLRAFAPGQPGQTAVDLQLQPLRSGYEAGQTVEIEARLKTDRPLDHARISGTVNFNDDQELPIAFLPDPARDGIYRARFTAVEPGQHTISAQVNLEGGAAMGDAATAINVTSPRGAGDVIPANPAALAHLARSTGGSIVDPDRPETWPDADATQVQTTQQTAILNLWDSFLLPVLLALLLGFDWFLRLIRGYV